MKGRIDLNFNLNIDCHKGCNKSSRKDIIEKELCTTTLSSIDSLPIRCVGEWAVQKIYLLIQYFGIFATGMKDKWAGEINYIEICSGPGRCVARENGIEFDGTALSIIKHDAFKYIKSALFFDFKEDVVSTLNKRISLLGIKKAEAIVGDYYHPKVIIDTISRKINGNSLNIIFIDPTDCSVPFSLLNKIKDALPNVDFIINLASGTDFNRNITCALLDQEKYHKTISKYAKFLGTDEFFKEPGNIKLANEKNNSDLRNKFRESYTESLKKIGYNYFEFEKVEHYYDLLFATKHKTGITFWKKATSIKFDGQRELF